MTDEAIFAVTAIKRNGTKRNGTPRKISIEIDVTVDGSPHTIRVRHNSGAMKAPDLEKRADWPDIKKRIADHFVTTVLEPSRQRVTSGFATVNLAVRDTCSRM